VAPCVTFEGVVRAIKQEPDGDIHVQVLVEASAQQFINARNTAAQHGALVLEIEPWEHGTHTRRGPNSRRSAPFGGLTAQLHAHPPPAIAYASSARSRPITSRLTAGTKLIRPATFKSSATVRHRMATSRRIRPTRCAGATGEAGSR
jgi:hypothetical protein